MRHLIFTNTPAHVHLYKHVVSRLDERGHEVLVLARDYGCTVELAEAYGLPFRVYGECDTTKASLLRNLPKQYLSIIQETRRFEPDLVFGMGAYAAHAGAVSGTPTVLVLDSEPTTLDHAISQPFARATLTPDSFRGTLGDDHFVFPGFKECAYLHPDVYSPDPSIRDELGVGNDPYVIVRLNAFGSHHDVSEGGFTEAECHQLVETLSDHATVFVSDEAGDRLDGHLSARNFDLHPARMHDALAGASLLVADTQTMVTEAALLGTPAIRSNSFVGRDDMGNFLELESRGLVENCRDFETVRKTALDLLTDADSGSRWERRRRALLEEKANLTELLVEVAQRPYELRAVEGLERRRSEEERATVATPA